MKYLFKLIPAFLFVITVLPAQAQVTLETKTLSLSIDEKGSVTSLFDKTNKQEYLLSGQKAPLLQLRIDGNYYAG
jgi:hypothetical protein